jgi:hypothetical protein
MARELKQFAAQGLSWAIATLPLAIAMPASAQLTFAFSGFEEPTTNNVQYTDTGAPNTDHDLVNNAGQAPVNYTSVGGELGFSSRFLDAPNGSSGLVNNDVGVRSNLRNNGGSQSFALEDIDGQFQLTFDPVDISGLVGVTVSFDYFLDDVPWENGGTNVDFFFATVIVDGNPITLFDTRPNDIDSLGIEGSWNTITQAISGNTAVLRFNFQSNGVEEDLFLDNITFQAVPFEFEASLGLLALTGLFVGDRYRKKLKLAKAINN